MHLSCSTIYIITNFTDSNISGVNFTGADLREANLEAIEGIHVIFDNVDFRGCGDIGSFPHEGTLCLRNCIGQDGQIIELLNEETVMEECRRRRRGPKMLNGVPIDQLPRFY